MIALLQRVNEASVSVSERKIAQIHQGLLVFIAIEPSDDELIADKLLKRITGYRVFEDKTGKMNLSVSQIGGDILFVPQFTLAADTTSGLRPSFSQTASPDLGRHLFHYLYSQAGSLDDLDVSRGEFGADMQVSLINDGPATFWLQVN